MFAVGDKNVALTFIQTELRQDKAALHFPQITGLGRLSKIEASERKGIIKGMTKQWHKCLCLCVSTDLG